MITKAEKSLFTETSSHGTVPLLVELWGQEKVRKTTTALTFPAPIYLLNFDRDASPIIARFPKKKIYVKDFQLPYDHEMTAGDAASILKEFWAASREALSQPFGTVVIDTVTHLWKVQQVYILRDILERRESRTQSQKEARIYPFDYARANTLYENLLLAPKYSRMHVVFIGRARAVYNSQSEPTGEVEAQVQKDTPYLVNLVVHLERRTEEVSFIKSKDEVKRIVSRLKIPKFVGVVEASGFDTSHVGEEIEDPTYEKFMKLLA